MMPLKLIGSALKDIYEKNKIFMIVIDRYEDEDSYEEDIVIKI